MESEKDAKRQKIQELLQVAGPSAFSGFRELVRFRVQGLGFRGSVLGYYRV